MAFAVRPGRGDRGPTNLDIDHFVPLAEAWDSGADQWDPLRREQFRAIDLAGPGSLIVVTATSNRSKSDHNLAEWRSPDPDYWCTYAKTWIEVKVHWDLTADQRGASRVGEMLANVPTAPDLWDQLPRFW